MSLQTTKPYTKMSSLGIHEFCYGIKELTSFIEQVKDPILAANIDITNAPELQKPTILRKSVVYNISGNQIGIIGFITPEAKIIGNVSEVTFLDEVESIRSEIEYLKNDGVNIFIAVGHSGYEREQEIAREVEDIDLVVGGRSHTFLWPTRQPERESVLGLYPTQVTQKTGKIVPVITMFAYTKYLGSLHVLFDSYGRLKKFSGNPMLLNNDIPEDHKTLQLVKKYENETTPILAEVIGRTSVSLDSESCTHKECNLGNLIADSMIYCYVKSYKGPHWSDASVALVESRDIRTDIPLSKEVPSPITKGHLLTLLPFANPVYRIFMNGTVLTELLEYGAYSLIEARKNKKFLQFSGLKVVYNSKNLRGERVVEVRVRCWECTVPKYEIIDSEKYYGVLMNDYLKRVYIGYGKMPHLQAEPTDFNESDCLESYIRDFKLIYPEIEGRIAVL